MGGVEWIDAVQGMYKLRAILNVVINIQVT
jgi:hypothetical protein